MHDGFHGTAMEIHSDFHRVVRPSGGQTKIYSICFTKFGGRWRKKGDRRVCALRVDGGAISQGNRQVRTYPYSTQNRERERAARR